MGIRVVAVYSEADRNALHVSEADEAVEIGPAAASESYLNQSRLLGAALATGAAAIHPGYGFLAENASFAQAVQDAGLIWVGPSPSAIVSMGDKVKARNLMSAAGVPVAAGTRSSLASGDEAVRAAIDIGYPIMVKASSGGGGIGMAVAEDDASLRTVFEATRTAGERFFGSADVFLERYVKGARHVEVQILGLSGGQVVTLGERDCSVQRRNQKVVEETPSPGVSQVLRNRMLETATRAGEAVDYRGAGTVEYLVDPSTQEFFFLEMNTRLQVEHPVTELVTGVDFVEEQLRIAAGEGPWEHLIGIKPNGHAIELRVCAEDSQNFFPSPGTITSWIEPAGEGIRVDSGYRQGDVVTPYYDSLLAKLCVWGTSRLEALDRARVAVAEFLIEGPSTNLAFLAEILNDSDFVSGHYDTGIVKRMRDN